MPAAVSPAGTTRRCPCLYERCCLCAADVQALAGVFSVLGKVAAFRTAYGVVQGIAVLLGIVRLVDMMAAHQRFAVLPRALALVSRALIWSCIWCLEDDHLGDRAEEALTPDASNGADPAALCRGTLPCHAALSCFPGRPQ